MQPRTENTFTKEEFGRLLGIPGEEVVAVHINVHTIRVITYPPENDPKK